MRLAGALLMLLAVSACANVRFLEDAADYEQEAVRHRQTLAEDPD